MPQDETLPSGPEPIEPRRFRGRRLLAGCAAVAVALLLAVVVAIVSFVGWLRTPGVPLEGRRLVDAGTILYAEVNLRAEDEIAVGILEKGLESGPLGGRGGDGDAEELPGPLRWGLGGRGRRISAGDLERTLPITIMVTRQEISPGMPSRALLAMSFPRLGNRMRLVGWVMSFVVGWGDEGGESASSYRNETLIEIEPGGERYWTSIVGSDFLLSKTEDAVRWGIDRIKDGSEGEPEAEAASLLAGRPEDALLYLRARPGYGNPAVALVERFAPELASLLRPFVQDAGEITMWASLESADVLSGEIHVGAGSPGESEQDEYSGGVTAVLPRGEARFTLEALPRDPGERHAWGLRVTGLETIGLGLFDRLQRRGAVLE